jgi:O-antigen ligase
MLVDKPHNMYLQILFGEGGIALLAFLTIILLYLVDSFRLYALKKQYKTNQIFGAALCLGVVGYLCAGMFNDSVVSVAPVFWIILGVGIAVNYENRRKLIREKVHHLNI